MDIEVRAATVSIIRQLNSIQKDLDDRLSNACDFGPVQELKGLRDYIGHLVKRLEEL